MTDLRDIPTGPHYAILRTESVHIPGDERSRANPGHRYPAETRTYVTYEAFTVREMWVSQVRDLAARGAVFRALSVTAALVRTDVSIEV